MREPLALWRKVLAWAIVLASLGGCVGLPIAMVADMGWSGQAFRVIILGWLMIVIGAVTVLIGVLDDGKSEGGGGG